MANKLFNRAKMTVSGTPGTGPITLNAAVTGYQSFVAAGTLNLDPVSYLIEDGANVELGDGFYTTSGTSLTRTTIRFSTNANAAISCTSAAIVTLTLLASDATDLPGSILFQSSSITAIPTGYIKTGQIYLQASYPALYAALGRIGDIYTFVNTPRTMTGLANNNLPREGVARNGPNVCGNGAGVFIFASNNTVSCRSSDYGVTWSNVTLPAQAIGIAWGGSQFVMLPAGTSANAYTSPDGVTWTTRTGVLPSVAWLSIAYNNGLFCAVSSLGVVYSSPDGITWTSRMSAPSGTMTVGPTKITALGASGFFFSCTLGNFYSANGTTWVNQGTTYVLDQCTGNPHGMLVACKDGTLWSSSDFGVTWTNMGYGTNGGYSGTYGGLNTNFNIMYDTLAGLFVAQSSTVFDPALGVTAFVLYTSYDGLNWTDRTAANTPGYALGQNLAGPCFLLADSGRIVQVTYVTQAAGNQEYAWVASTISYTASTQFYVPPVPGNGSSIPYMKS
jgi:hypothetical protein